MEYKHKFLKDAVEEALRNMGGEGHYKNDIYKEIDEKNLYNFSNQKTPWQSINEVLQSEKIFYNVYGVDARKGIWGLKEYKNTTKNEFADLIETDKIETDKIYNEGAEQLKIHKGYERNSELVRNAKVEFKRKNDRLFCEVCGFDFSEKYGELGEDFIEAHHKKPLNEVKESNNTIDDLAMICSNCHRMIHRETPCLEIDDLKKIIEK